MRKAERRYTPCASRLTPHVFDASRESGMALVLTLMVVSIITAMVVEFAYGVYVNTSALHNWQTSQELSVAARSATKLAARLIVERGQEHYSGSVFEISQNVPFGDLHATITIRVEDENAKFNLNDLGGTLNVVFNPDQEPYSKFLRLVRAAGLEDEVAQRIGDWIDSNSEPRLGDSENGAKNGKLDSVDELLLIPGIEVDTYRKLLPYVTIYGDASVNINSASVPVLLSLSDSMTRDLAERIVKYREITPFGDKSELAHNVAGFEGGLGTSLMGYISTRGSAFHVIATAEANGVKRVVESVLEGNRVQYWKEM